MDKVTPPSKTISASLPVVSGDRKDHRRDQIRPDRPQRKSKQTGRNAEASDPQGQHSLGFEAQNLSGGENRGLKGGQNLLERAKKTYMKTEYSGPHDRRPSPGIIKKTEI